MKKPITVCTTGLGHPEGPYELDDGRVIYANTYASEIGVWDPKTGKAGVYADVGGGPNACMLGSDGCVYSTQTPNVGSWVAPVHRPPSIQKTSPSGKVEILVTEADGVKFDGPERSHLRTGRAALFHRFRRLGARHQAASRPHRRRSRRTARRSILEELDHVYPNGIVAEPDGSIVWVESYTLNVVRRKPDGAKQVIHTMPDGHIPDGLKIDSTAISGSPRSPPAASTSSTRTASHWISSRPAARSSTASSARAARSFAATWDRSTSPARR